MPPAPGTPTLARDVPSPLLSGSAERSTPHRGPDSDSRPPHLLPPPVRPRDHVPTERELASHCPSGRTPPPRGLPDPSSSDARSSGGSLRSPGSGRGTPGAFGLTPFSPTSKTDDYLVHVLRTTLWTFSLLFKSPPGEGGGKTKNPEEIRANRKEKKLQRGVRSGEKR